MQAGRHGPLVLEPTLSVPQSGLREHRWTLILSWLFHITAETFEFILGHRRKPAKTPPPPPSRVEIRPPGVARSVCGVLALRRVCVWFCSKQRGACQVCVLQLVLWIRPMTHTSYKPAISQHQGGTVPLPSRPRRRCCWGGARLLATGRRFRGQPSELTCACLDPRQGQFSRRPPWRSATCMQECLQTISVEY